MYKVEFTNFSDVVQHTLTSEILDIDISARELESEKANYKHPQRATIRTEKTSWLTQNIMRIPKNNVGDKNILAFKVLIYWNLVKIATMYMPLEFQDDIADSQVCTITCYDAVKIIELYSDESFTNTNKRNAYSSDDLFTMLKERIEATEPVLNIPLISTDTPLVQGTTDGGIIKLLNLDIDLDELEEIPSDLRLEVDKWEVEDSPSFPNPDGWYYEYFGRHIKAGIFFPGHQTIPLYPRLKIYCWSAWRAWVANPYPYVAPRFCSRLNVWEFDIYNLTAPELVKKEELIGSWSCAFPCYTTGLNLRTFEQMLNTQTQWGVDIPVPEGDATWYIQPAWRTFINKVNEIHSDVVGGYVPYRGNRLINTINTSFPIQATATGEAIDGMTEIPGTFILSESGENVRYILYRIDGDVFDPGWTGDINIDGDDYNIVEIFNDQHLEVSDYDGVLGTQITWTKGVDTGTAVVQMNIVSTSVGQATDDINRLEKIELRRAGVSIPHKVNLKTGTINILNAFKEVLYTLNQTLDVDEDGSIKIINKHPVIDMSSGVNEIDDDDIEILTKIQTGIMPATIRRFSTFMGDTDYLENELDNLIADYRHRRKIRVTKLGIEYSPEIDLLDKIRVDALAGGYVSQIKKDRKSDKEEITINIVDLPVIQFTVSHGGSPIENASVSIKIRGGRWRRLPTNVSGIATFYNVPQDRYQYRIFKEDYNLIEGWIDVVDDITYYVNRQMNVSVPQSPEIEVRQSPDRPTLIEIYSIDHLPIYYTTDGSTPDTNDPDQEYKEPFYIYEQKDIKAVVINSHDKLSLVSEELAVPSSPLIDSPTIYNVYAPDNKDSLVISMNHPDGDAVIRYTLDGSEPDESSTVYEGEIYLPKSLKIEKIRAKAFQGFDSLISAEAVYYNDNIELEARGEVKVLEDETEVFNLDLATYRCKITVMIEMYHQEQIGFDNVDVLLSAVRTFDARFASLSAYGDGESWSDILSLEEINTQVFSTSGIFGRINRFVAGTYDSGVDISLNVPYIDVNTSVVHAGGNVIELRVRIDNALNLATGICDDLDYPTVTYKIKVEPMRLIPEPYQR